MQRKLIVAIAVLVLVLSLAGTALAANPHTAGTTGQPNQNCEVLLTTPGNAGSSSNLASPFAGGHAADVYAGSRINAPTTASPNAVSQYDVACFQQFQSHP